MSMNKNREFNKIINYQILDKYFPASSITIIRKLRNIVLLQVH